jgi:hypothetical protein
MIRAEGVLWAPLFLDGGVREVLSLAAEATTRSGGNTMAASTELEARRESTAKNQSLFREVNERIEESAEAESGDRFGSSGFARFVCECSDETCTEWVSLTIEEYEHVRTESDRFFVVPGHHVPEVEAVIAASDRYLIVKKLGAGKRVAEKLDPRSRG